MAEFDSVTVRLGTADVLSHVTFRVQANERWVVLGANGAGKTTLLQVLAARKHPTQGTVRLLGETLGACDVFELRPRIGLASTSLSEAIPARETVVNAVMTASWAVTGRWREHYDDVDVQRARSLLNEVGMADLADRTVGTLSEGEYKRTLIARALMPDPEMLLLDEPAAGLDIGAREDLVARLARIAADEGAPTTILVTHHLEEIPVGFDHALLLRSGHVVAQGAIGDVLQPGHLTEAFGVPLTVEHKAGRWAARMGT